MLCLVHRSFEVKKYRRVLQNFFEETLDKRFRRSLRLDKEKTERR